LNFYLIQKYLGWIKDKLPDRGKSFSEFLRGWTNILGDRGVAVDNQIRRRYARTPGLADRVPVAVLWPVMR